MSLADELALARVVTIEFASADVLRVTTFPAIGGIDRRFTGRDAFQEALALACNAAAGLGYTLTDRTGTLSPDECAALVAGRSGVAEIVPIAARRQPQRA
ncbi:hypothetical protein [Porphyrobacter sp. LM 6]|uniref:hypothetical protein n=1 Tax=Porphyrobacter sp. LM 6 TaxID=1896196 RepID=UPI000846BBD8|nr:hypothetical protein [Porphyrobacter sp. LM 6]AOL94671.1 hypothetical protein BG023_111746 [Porphyrobacter sp. LM 6]